MGIVVYTYTYACKACNCLMASWELFHGSVGNILPGQLTERHRTRFVANQMNILIPAVSSLHFEGHRRLGCPYLFYIFRLLR